MNARDVLPWAGRLVLSLGILVGAAVAWKEGPRLRARLVGEDETGFTTPAGVATPGRPPALHEPPPWPAFAGGTRRGTSRQTLNGVEVITEDWACRGTGRQILEQFRDAMIARGWQDVTEEEFGLRPELTALPDRPDQAATAAEFYDRTLASELVLRRLPWSVHLSVADERGARTPRCTASVLAARTPSLGTFTQNLVGQADRSQNPGGGRLLDSYSKGPQETYHTTVRTVSRPADEAFEAELLQLQRSGWRRVITAPAPRGIQGQFAWLARENQYAALLVRALTSGGETSVTLTEVTPR